MKDFTTWKQNNKITRPLAICFWLGVWQIASAWIGQEILLVSPVVVAGKLWEMVQQQNFWSILFFSFEKVTIGFIIAVVLGTVTAFFATKSAIVRELLAPINHGMKATPVASFSILALLWLPSENLAMFASFLMAFPIVYSNIWSGISSMDNRLEEMAIIFHISLQNRLKYIYLPQLMPYFISACTSGIGMCWKAGIAAEVIATPDGSIGDMLYRAKLYLDTGELFAWTAVVVIISIIFEKVFLILLHMSGASLQGGKK